MKNLLVAFIIASTISCAAQTIPPQSVQTGFTKQFPNIAVKKWDKEDGNYEANFTKDTKTMSATFNANGEWLETETEIKVADLPANITSYITDHYKGAKIKEAAMLNTPGGDRYEAEVKGKDLMFDMQGNFIKAQED